MVGWDRMGFLVCILLSYWVLWFSFGGVLIRWVGLVFDDKLKILWRG